MRRNKHAQLDLFFKDILPHWREDIPELSSLLEAEKFVKGEHLVNDWGDLYLITEGIFGKYEKTCPVRYALAGESLMIPNQKHNYRFVALSDCQTFRTSFRQLEAINAYNPKVFYLYAHLKDQQLRYLDYRHKLLSLHNQDKYDFVFDHYPELLAYITQKELAQFMGISMELLRRMMRDRAY